MDRCASCAVVQPIVALAAVYSAGSTGLLWYNSKILSKLEEDMSSDEGLYTAFRRLYARQLAEGDEFVNSLWKRVVGPLRLAVATQGLGKLEKVGTNGVWLHRWGYHLGFQVDQSDRLHGGCGGTGVEVRAEGDAADPGRGDPSPAEIGGPSPMEL